MSNNIFSYSLIPEELKKEKRWVLWKKINGAKIPFNAKTGGMAQPNNELTWNSFEYCNSIYQKQIIKCEGLGFMLGGGYFGIDIDYKEGKEKEFESIKNEILSSIFSYTEYSQSGKGIHIIAKGVLPSGNRRKGVLEMYDNARFFALTGEIYDNRVDLYNREKEIKPIFNKYFLNSSPSYTYQKPITNSNYYLSDDEIINKALKSENKAKFSLLWSGEWEGIYPSQSEADFAFVSLLAFWSNKNKEQMDRIFRKSGLMREKWDRKTGNNTYGNIVLDKAIATCKEVYGSFDKSDANQYLSFNTDTGEVNIKKNYDLNDTGNAERFFDLYGSNIKYNFSNKVFLIYNGVKWETDNKEKIRILINKMLDKMKKELEEISDKDYQNAFSKNIKHLSNNAGKEAMLKEFKHLVAIENKDLDTQNTLLNTPNGILDLTTGLLLPHNKDYFISKSTSVEVSFDTPSLWLDFLNSTFQNNSELIDYIQVALGYTFTGLTKEQILFECVGNGNNGKGVLFGVIYDILNDYATNIKINTILTKTFQSSGNASPDIAKLSGARFVRTNEPNEGARFDEGFVKEITGEDIITARFLYGNEFDFKPNFKLWIACNNKIVIRGNDNGIWRRMRLICFDKVFKDEEIDKDLKEKLKSEYPQILGWCVKGAIKYFKEGMNTPKQVIQAVSEYRKEMDILEKFIDEKCKLNDTYKIKANDLYNEYKIWSKSSNEWDMSSTRFGREMGKKFNKIKIGGYVFYQGIDLLSKHTGYIYEK